MTSVLHILAGTNRGGCEHDAMCLVQMVPEVTHYVLVLKGPGEMSEEFAAAGAEVRHLDVLYGPARRLIESVRNAVQEWAPSGVVIWHGMVALPEMLHALHRFPGRVLVHGGNPATSLPFWVNGRYLLREQWLGRRCDVTYVCCSRYVAASFASSRYLRRFRRVVVPNGVKTFAGDPHAPRTIAEGETFTIGMLARLDLIKDHDTLLQGFALVRERWPAARLEIAGDGPRRGALEALATKLGLGTSVTFLGTVEDVYGAMRRWDLFAYCTTEREGLGNALAEAMLFGMPTVVTDVGPVAEVIGNPRNAVLVAPGAPRELADAILALIPDKERRQSLAVASHQWAEVRYSPRAFAHAHMSLLAWRSLGEPWNGERPSAPPPRSGQARRVLHVLAGTDRGGCEANALCLMQSAPWIEHYVAVLGESGPMSRDLRQSANELKHLKVLHSAAAALIRKIRDAVAQWQPDGIVVWHGMIALPEILHALHNFPGRVLVHGGNPAHSLSAWVDWRYLLRENLFEPRCEATYVCCSRYVAASFGSSRYLRQFPRVVVPNGVKPLTGAPHAPRTIGEDEPFTIGMLARLDEIKDHETLVRAFAIIAARCPAARLELAGDGDRRPALEALSEQLGLKSRVIFLGMIQDVYGTMRHWDFFAYCTTDREGLGNALAEAMMLGLPTVATDVGPIAQVAGRPPAVKLVPPGQPELVAEALLSLRADPTAAAALSRAARERAQKEFAPATFTRRYLELLGLDPTAPEEFATCS